MQEILIIKEGEVINFGVKIKDDFKRLGTISKK